MRVCDICKKETAGGWMRDREGRDLDICTYHLGRIKDFIKKLKEEESVNEQQ